MFVQGNNMQTKNFTTYIFCFMDGRKSTRSMAQWFFYM